MRFKEISHWMAQRAKILDTRLGAAYRCRETCASIDAAGKTWGCAAPTLAQFEALTQSL